MTTIGIVSDTHIPDRATHLPRQVVEHFRSVDMIFHAGDISSPAPIERLRSINRNLHVVEGNNLGDHLNFSPRFPKRLVIEVGAYKIGMVHGVDNQLQRVLDGVLVQYFDWPKNYPDIVRARVRKHFADVDCIVFGHTHWPMIATVGDILFFNPGSTCGRGRSAPPVSYGLLEVDETGIHPKLVTVPTDKHGRFELDTGEG